MFNILLALLLLSCNRFTEWKEPRGGDFTLTSSEKSFNTIDHRGKTLFVFFGFLNCPHVCPTTIRELGRMMKELTPSERVNVVPVFISVDPKRDTPAALKEFFSTRDPGFIATSGSEDELRQALSLFGGDYKITVGEKSGETFIDHTSSVFVINRKGIWVNSLPYDAKKEEFIKALKLASSQPPYWSLEAVMGRIKDLGFNQDCDLAVKPCEFKTSDGDLFTLDLHPRPVTHLEKTTLTVKSNDNPQLIPHVADLVGIELGMGLIRPKLEETSKNVWSGTFTLPSCDLKGMNWHLRLLLKNHVKEDHQIKFKFSSVNKL